MRGVARQVGDHRVDGGGVVGDHLADRARGERRHLPQGHVPDGRHDALAQPVAQPRLGDVRDPQAQRVARLPGEERGHGHARQEPQLPGRGALLAEPQLRQARHRRVGDDPQDGRERGQRRRPEHRGDRGADQLLQARVLVLRCTHRYLQ